MIKHLISDRISIGRAKLKPNRKWANPNPFNDKRNNNNNKTNQQLYYNLCLHLLIISILILEGKMKTVNSKNELCCSIESD